MEVVMEPQETGAQTLSVLVELSFKMRNLV